jgi:hypothetical protein
LLAWCGLLAFCRAPSRPPRAEPVEGPLGGAKAEEACAPGEDGAPGADTEPRAYAGIGARLEAAEDLARLGPDGVAALRAAVADEVAEVRAVAALALADGGEEDRRSVESLLRDADSSVRFAAGIALLRHEVKSGLAWRVTLTELTASETLADVPAATDADAARAISLALAADATWAAPRLFRISPGLQAKAAPLLRAMVEERDTRRDALEMLGRCGAPGVEALADLDLAWLEDWSDQREAAIAFLQLGCRIDEALPVLAENSAWVLDPRRWADDWGPVVPALRRSLSGRGPISDESALRTVRGVGPPASECLPEIYGLLGRADLAPLAACAFASIGPASEPALEQLLPESERGGTCHLWPDDVPCVGPPVLGFFTHGPELRERLFIGRDSAVPLSRDMVFLRAAARIAPCHPDVVRAALKRLDDPDASVRVAATLALDDALRIGNVAVEPVRARFVHDPVAHVRAAAASVLARAAWGGRDEATDALSSELESGDSVGKEYAARALAMAGEDGALARALESESALTRAWSAAAIFDPQAERFPAGNEWEELAVAMSVEQLRKSRAAAVIKTGADDPDSAVRRVAVGVVLRMPQHFSDTWERTLAAAASDPDVDVNLIAYVAAKHWQTNPWQTEARGAAPPGLVEELAREMRGEGRPTPVDSVLGGADAELAAIAADRSLLAFERWFAARASH